MKSPRFAHHLVVACVATMMVLGAGMVAAQEGGDASAQQRKEWWERKSVQQELGLGVNQVRAIALIETAHKESVREHRKVQQQAYRKMMKLLSSESFTEDEIVVARQALEQAWTESIRQNVEHWVELRYELSAEQWKKLPKVAPRVLQLGGLRTRAMGTIKVGEQSD